jgi:hypothetical protein
MFTIFFWCDLVQMIPDNQVDVVDVVTVCADKYAYP